MSTAARQPAEQEQVTGKRPLRRRLWTTFWLLVAVSVPLLYNTARDHFRAAALLMRLASPDRPHHLLPGYRVSITDLELASPTGTINARLYTPVDAENPPGMVVVHGVHHLGIAEPRLVAFSKSLAAEGVEVLTPELPGIADYHIDAHDIETIGYATSDLSHRVHEKRVGVLGLSFAGGLALLAAVDPRYSANIGFVTAVGAHDDMARVARFFATDEIITPNGTVHAQAHEYGPLVLIYEHPQDFFSAGDLQQARLALRLQLYEQPADAQAAAAKLTGPDHAIVEALLKHDRSSLRDALLSEIDKDSEEMARVSPHGKLGGIHADVLLLHGAEDDVIPPSETKWLAREVPPDRLKAELITPLLSHVNLQGGLELQERWRLLNFMATMLAESRETTY